MRKLCVILCFAMLTSVTVAASSYGSVGAVKGNALFVAPDGSDAGNCTRERPCESFARAYRVAAPGDTVFVAGATYPEQTIPADSKKSGARADVVFRPQPGSRVIVDGDLDIHATRIQFHDIAAELWYAHPGSSHLTFRNVDVDRFYITSASNIRVLGGDIGPSVDKVSQIKSATDSTTPPRAILLSGLRVHDFTRSSKSQHMECLHVMAVDGLTIRNSRFERCSIFDISFNEHGDTDAMRGILVENNVFDRTLDGGHYAVHFSSGDPCEATIRFNTFLQGVSAECPETGAGVRFESNIMPSMNSALCGRNGYTFDWNVYESGQRCGPNDRVARVAFVDRDRLDLRLVRGSAAIGRGNPEAAPAHDIAGQRRPVRWRPDAGAHQSEPAAIVPGRSIGAVRLGAPRATVERSYGGARFTRRVGDFARVQYSVPGGRLWIRYSDDRVVAVGTSSRYYSTVGGIGAGAPIRSRGGIAHLPWDDCRKAFRRAVGSVAVYYAPAGGKKGRTLRGVSMFVRTADDCVR